MNIPASWIYEYVDALPEDSPSRTAIINMLVQFMKEQEDEQ